MILIRPAFVCLVSLTSAAAAARAESVCSVALTARAFDTINMSTTQNIAFASRDDLCNRTYNSLQEAQSAARSSGFNVSYGGVGIGANDAHQNSEGRWQIDQTDFCRATAEAFQAAYASSYSSQMATAALAAWSDCIKTTNQNQLFMTYQVDPSGNFLAGILKTTVNTGELDKDVRGITVSGPDAANAECTVLNVKMKANQALQKPLHLTATDTGIACSKTGDGGAAISIATSAGSLPFVEMPSREQVAKRQRELEAEQSNLEAAYADLKQKVASLRSDVKNIETGKASAKELSDAVDWIKSIKVSIFPKYFDVPAGAPSGGSIGCPDPGSGLHATAVASGMYLNEPDERNASFLRWYTWPQSSTEFGYFMINGAGKGEHPPGHFAAYIACLISK